ncbi:hypothetical protein [Legionella sp.]|uniref:hypothetical protein n=1 Tax=Legionella sp. TaxID=459 RepID=UPI003CA5735F
MNKSCLLFTALLSPLNGICTTVLPIYPAEVVGRDLDAKGAGWMGHVGITMAANLSDVAPWVVEVLNDPNRVVQVNNISDFKKKSPYWGSRYGIANDRERTLLVLKEANSQRCLRSKYTLTTFFFPATGSLDGYPTDTCKTETMGQFRCDTFLIYAYTVGNYSVLKSGAALPKNVFASFPYGNGDGPQAFDNLPLTPDTLPVTQSSLNTLSPTDLNNLSLENFISVIDNPDNATTSNIGNKIWDIYVNYQIEDVNKKTFLLDYLGGVGSANLLPEVIKEYNQSTNLDIKHALLSLTQTIYSREHLLQENLSIKDQLISFYLDLLNNNTPKNRMSFSDAQIVATGLTDIASKKTLLDNIEKINLIFDMAQPYEQMGYKCNLMLDIKSLEDSYIPQIIHLLTKENNRQLDERFFSYIKEALSRDINNLSPANKNIIRNYFKSIDYKFNRMNAKLLNTDKPSSMFTFGAWLESSALINSSSLEDAGHFIAKFLKHKSTVEQANYIIGLSKADYLKHTFKTEPVFREFAEKNNNINLVPISKNPNQELINSGIQYSVSLIEGKI